MHDTPKFGHSAGSGLALLTLIGLLAAPAARAQTLALGQSGSTTLSGTATLAFTGTTASGTYTYSNTGGKALANQTHFQNLYTYGPSTANDTGGNVDQVNTFNNSTFNISTAGSGGFVEFLFADDASTANIGNGGNIQDLFANNTSAINVTGGSVSQLFSSGTSMASVSGGLVGTLVTQGAATANISSGATVSLLETEGTSTVSITGGNIASIEAYTTSTVDIRGGALDQLNTGPSGTIDVFGTGLQATLLSGGAGATTYKLTGTLQDGETLDADYLNQGGTLELNNLPTGVPEASTVASFGLLLALGMGGLIVEARRKKATTNAA